MARPLRIEYPGAVYHVMNRGLARRPVFLGPADHDRFIALLADVAQRWQVRVYAYCCMTNHYHLLLQTPLPNLSRVMRHLDGVYTQRFNLAHQCDGPLFRGRYKAILIEAETYLVQLVRYIHLNPVAAGLTQDPGAYPWSSHRLYRQPAAPAWLARENVIVSFPNLPSFEKFVAAGDEDSLKAFYARVRWSPVLGSKKFAAWVLQAARRSREHPRAQRTPQLPSLDAVIEAVCWQMSVTPESIIVTRRGASNIPRDVAIYVASRIAGFSRAAVGQFFGVDSTSAITRACDRTHRRLGTTPYLRRALRSLAP